MIDVTIIVSVSVEATLVTVSVSVEAVRVEVAEVTVRYTGKRLD